MSRLIVVRHGNTFAPGEPVRRIGAATDLPLTAEGVEQGAAIGQWLRHRGLRFDALLSGPLQRAQGTATVVAAAAGLAIPIRVVAWLDEIDHGPDEGRPEEEVVARLGADALAAWDRGDADPPGWRVDREARLAAWRCLLSEAGDRDTLAITSNGAARFALAAAAVAPPASVKLRTGAYGELARDRDGGWRLIDWDARP